MANGPVSIPPAIYIVIGAAVVLMSLIVGLNSTGLEKMSIFILVGAVFILVGFVKFLLRQNTRSAPKHAPHPRAHAAQHAPHSAAHPSQNPAHHSHHPQHQHPVPHKGGVHPAVVASAHHQNVFIKCPGCGIRIHPSFRYCPGCGHMLRN